MDGTPVSRSATVDKLVADFGQKLLFTRVKNGIFVVETCKKISQRHNVE